ncbi:MAG: GNAT family N-acetyltransferase [Chitinophagaceae bacterium]
MILFRRTSSADNDFRELVVLLDKDLALRDGDEHAFYAQFNKIQAIKNVIVCYEENQPVGCGAFKEFEPGKVEIKRMYVHPEQRGKGTGLAILTQLENWARELGYTSCVLETGKKQPEAIRLYKKAGYHITENYGQYASVENSVCMRKEM